MCKFTMVDLPSEINVLAPHLTRTQVCDELLCIGCQQNQLFRDRMLISCLDMNHVGTNAASSPTELFILTLRLFSIRHFL